jgi:hypothetical protein
VQFNRSINLQNPKSLFMWRLAISLRLLGKRFWYQTCTPNGGTVADGVQNQSHSWVFDGIWAKFCFCNVYSPPSGIYT